MTKKIFLAAYSLLLFIIGFGQPQTYPTSFTVAKDGSGNFKTIQEAINAVRDLSQQQVTIHIKKGVYEEKLVIPSWKTNISLVGENRDSTIITNNDYSGKAYPGLDAFGRDKYSTYNSYTVLVQGNDFSCRKPHHSKYSRKSRAGRGITRKRRSLKYKKLQVAR
jgi:pectinesterase